MKNENESKIVAATPAPLQARNIHDVESVSGSIVSVEQYVSSLEQKVEFQARMMRCFVKATKSHDWIDFGGKPYLEGEGAMRIAAVAGLGIRVIAMHKQTIEAQNGHYRYFATVEVSGGNRPPVTDEGDCASNDRFFQRNKIQPPAAEINESDVRKKAIENARSRAICSFLGLRGLSWEDLSEYGLSRAGAGAKVAYKSSQSQNTEQKETKSGPQEQSSDHETAWAELLSLEQRAASFGIEPSKFWTKITTYKAKNGEEYKHESRESAEKFFRNGKEKYGECKALFVWRSNAQARVAKLEEADLEDASLPTAMEG